MSTDAQTAAPPPAAETPADPILAALQPHAARLHPGGMEQLARIWADDFKGLGSETVKDLVDLRLGRSEYAHFMKPVDVQAERRAANTARVKAAIDRARVSATGEPAPGLDGSYGR